VKFDFSFCAFFSGKSIWHTGYSEPKYFEVFYVNQILNRNKNKILMQHNTTVVVMKISRLFPYRGYVHMDLRGFFCTRRCGIHL
jgi:hypothetical protein